MKVKKQKTKFIRNVIIGVIALHIVAFIINIAPGYKRNRFKGVTNLVIGEENVTEKLNNPVYKDEDGYIYLSKEDIKLLFDKTIYYDDTEKMLITTSETASGSMIIGENVITINGSTRSTFSTIIYRDNIMYIPIQDFTAIYNIEVKYLEEPNIVVIDKLNEGMIMAQTKIDTKIRFKQRSLSKKVGTLHVGEEVYAFYTTSKGWRQIRTIDGTVGYVKANTLTNEYILRQDLNLRPNTKCISSSIQDGQQIQQDGTTYTIKDLLKLTNEGILLKNTEINDTADPVIWANLDIGNIDFSKMDYREKTIKNIISISMKNDIKCVNIVATESNENLERFIIELAPQLREIGIKLSIVENKYFSNIDSETYAGIVDYIVK